MKTFAAVLVFTLFADVVRSSKEDWIPIFEQASTNQSRTGVPVEFKIPGPGTYKIKIGGAAGGNFRTFKGGYGVTGEGIFNFTEPLEKLQIIIGSVGKSTTDGMPGGGGGTFVYHGIKNLLMAAGGGGGAAFEVNGSNASVTENATDSPFTTNLNFANYICVSDGPCKGKGGSGSKYGSYPGNVCSAKSNISNCKSIGGLGGSWGEPSINIPKYINITSGKNGNGIGADMLFGGHGGHSDFNGGDGGYGGGGGGAASSKTQGTGGSGAGGGYSGGGGGIGIASAGGGGSSFCQTKQCIFSVSSNANQNGGFIKIYKQATGSSNKTVTTQAAVATANVSSATNKTASKHVTSGSNKTETSHASVVTTKVTSGSNKTATTQASVVTTKASTKSGKHARKDATVLVPNFLFLLLAFVANQIRFMNE